MISKTKHYSWKVNNLTNGCKECVLGRKLVVFVTGICPKSCFYCPLSEQKKNQDVIFANERPLTDENDIDGLINEAIASKSNGAGFTGGDPLTRIDRTCKFIKALKNKFGNQFHIHLYTILETMTKEKLQKLSDAGLDELRFHPDLKNKKFWNKLDLLKNTGKKYKFIYGVEIPCVPGYEKETVELIDYFLPHIKFLNINELEISDTNYFHMKNKNFKSKAQLSYGVKGSQELALKLLKYINKKYPNSNAHYCTCKLKDKIQLRERLKRRALNIKREFDIVTEDGTIIRGAIYTNILKPGFSYIKKLKDMNISDKEKILKDLLIVRKSLIEEYSIPENMLEVDNLKLRIITNVGIVQQLSKYLKSKKLIPAIIEQYPSYDQMEVDVEFL